MRVPHLLATPEEKSAWVVDQVTKRILLFEHFRVDPKGENPWRDLAMALARKHVPGFAPPPKPQGRPRQRGDDAIALVMSVELLQRRDGLSVRRAIKLIANAGVIEGAEETLRDLYKEVTHPRAPPSKRLRPMVKLFDRAENLIGRQAFIECLNEALGLRMRPEK